MTQAPRGPIVIDTGVFGAQLTPRTWPLGELYRPLVEGRAALIPFITVTELASEPNSPHGGHEGRDDSSTSWSEQKPSGQARI